MSKDLKLGYLGFEVSDTVAWSAFARDVLGLSLVDEQSDGGFALRMDDYAWRFSIAPGPADDLSVMGWEAPTDAVLSELAKRVEASGVQVRRGSDEECARRRVQKLVAFADPAGVPLEVFVGPERANQPFRSELVKSGFVTGDQGMGHAVITANSQSESHRFYVDLLGFRLSDHIRCDLHGYKVDIEFLHANSRHHSVAFGDGPQKKRLHHFMIEAGAMDEVGLAFDRALRSGVRIMQTLGRHPNDRMFSFYARTPSGFQFEFGWGGRSVDDATFQPTTYDRISEWGHHPPQMLAGPPPGRPR
jgi:2,3-dihydroxybiphenyl 1,2-dioxygenase